MLKEEFLKDQVKTLKLFWPEKSEEEIRKSCEKTYDKFKEVVDEI